LAINLKRSWLVGGWHRLEAVRKLGHDSIEAKVLDGVDADAALLAEIDENLIRAELSPAERKLHIARRKELYDAQPNAPKRGGDRRSKSPKETCCTPSTAEHSAIYSVVPRLPCFILGSANTECGQSLERPSEGGDHG
jgi:hypothetical protein